MRNSNKKITNVCHATVLIVQCIEIRKLELLHFRKMRKRKAYCTLRDETKRNEMERNEMDRNEMKICSMRNENP